MTSRMNLSSKFLIRNPQHFNPHSWHTSIKEINKKLTGHHSWVKIISSMTSSMIPSSKFTVRSPYCWHTSNKDVNIKDDPLIQVSSQEPSTSSKHPLKDPLSTLIFQGIFLGGLARSSMMSIISQSSKSLVRKLQCPQRTPILDILQVKISSWKFQGIFLEV